MPFRANATDQIIFAWDTAARTWKTGLTSAQVTIRGTRDAVSFTPSVPAWTEISATYHPGEYRVSIIATENDGSVMTLGGTCTVAGIVLLKTRWQNEISADMRKFLGSTPPAPYQAGVPKIEVLNWQGALAPTLATDADVAAAIRDVDNTTPAASSLGAAINARAIPGDKMDLIDAPNATALTAILTAILARFPSGAVATDAGNSATVFKTNRTEATTDYFKDCLCLITSGALIYQVKKVTGYNGTSKAITVQDGYTGTPADGVTFRLINE